MSRLLIARPSRNQMLRGLAALVAVASFTALLAGVGAWTEKREMALKAQALQHALEAHALGLQSTAERFDFLPLACARHPAVMALLEKPGDKDLGLQVNTYLEELNRLVGASALYLLDRQGLTLAASNWQGGDSFVGKNYSQRPYFEKSLAGERSVYYGVGLTTGVPGLFIGEPVRSGSGITGVIVVKVGLDAVQAAWASAPDPVLLSDGRGVVFLSSVPGWLYSSRRPLAKEDVAWLNEQRQYGLARRDYPVLPWRVEGGDDRLRASPYKVQAEIAGAQRTLLVADTSMPRTDWTLSVMADLSEVSQAKRMAQVLTGLVVLLAVLSLLYWRLRERRRAEQRQRIQEAQLQHAARLASLGELASTLAHELGQPLMALSSYAVAAQRFADQNSRDMLGQTLTEMQAQARRAADIVARMRGFVRQRSRGQERCEIRDIVASVLALVTPEITRLKSKIELDLPASLPAVSGDRLLLEQLLLNLVMNALQAMKDSSEDGRSINIRARSGDGIVRLEIQDSGPGIPADVAPRLFEPFFTTKPDGLGVGLKICRSIAESHGGRLTHAAAPQGGALFSLSLPLGSCKKDR